MCSGGGVPSEQSTGWGQLDVSRVVEDGLAVVSELGVCAMDGVVTGGFFDVGAMADVEADGAEADTGVVRGVGTAQPVSSVTVSAPRMTPCVSCQRFRWTSPTPVKMCPLRGGHGFGQCGPLRE